MSNVPLDLYFLCRRIGDGALPSDIFQSDLAEKYGNFDKKDIFQKHARYVHLLNPDDFDSHTARTINEDKELVEQTSKENGMPFDKNSPATDEENKTIDRLKSYTHQKVLFSGSRSGTRDYHMAPEHMSDSELNMLRNVKSDDSDLSYFDDIGKHLYAEHGWCLGNFQAHPSQQEREIAHELEHNPIMGSTQAGGTTYFDELAAPFSQGTRTPVLGKPAPNMVRAHMKLLHGFPGDEEDHKRDHISGNVSNHSHDASDFE